MRSLALALCLIVCLAAPAAAQVGEPYTAFEKWAQARTERDVDATLAQFADDAVVRIEDRGTATFTGRAEIRRFLQNVGMRSTIVVTPGPTLIGNTITWYERDQGQARTPVDMRVEALIQGGKIKRLVYTAGSRQLPSETTAAGALLPAGWASGALALLATMLLTLPWLGSRRATVRSSLSGRLLAELGRSRRQSV